MVITPNISVLFLSTYLYYFSIVNYVGSDGSMADPPLGALGSQMGASWCPSFCISQPTLGKQWRMAQRLRTLHTREVREKLLAPGLRSGLSSLWVVNQ